jgi:hypothetical protein
MVVVQWDKFQFHGICFPGGIPAAISIIRWIVSVAGCGQSGKVSKTVNSCAGHLNFRKTVKKDSKRARIR